MIGCIITPLASYLKLPHWSIGIIIPLLVICIGVIIIWYRKKKRGVSIAFRGGRNRTFDAKALQKSLELLKDNTITGDARKAAHTTFENLLQTAKYPKRLNAYKTNILKDTINYIINELKKGEFYEENTFALYILRDVKSDNIRQILKDNALPVLQSKSKTLSLKARCRVLRMSQKWSEAPINLVASLIKEAIEVWTKEEFDFLKDCIELDYIENKEQKTKELYKIWSEAQKKGDNEKARRAKFFTDSSTLKE